MEDFITIATFSYPHDPSLKGELRADSGMPLK
jgi:hypothetical protein